MHLLAEESIDIHCPAPAAYAYACDLRNFGEWFPGVIRIVAEDELALTTAGKSYLETVAVPLRGHRKVRIVVKTAEPDCLFVTEGSLRPLQPRMEIRFSPVAPASVRVGWRMYSLNSSVLVRAVVIPLARRVMRKRAKAAMTHLKRKLES